MEFNDIGRTLIYIGLALVVVAPVQSCPEMYAACAASPKASSATAASNRTFDITRTE